MKLAIFAILLVTLMDIDRAKAYMDEVLYLYRTELKPDEPLRINSSYTELRLSDATGSIGVKTFSEVPQLLKLKIDGSAIDNVEEGALCSPPQLQTLSLYNMTRFPKLTLSLLGNCNKILTFTAGRLQIEPDTLSNMTSLESLEISYQTILHLNKDYFQPLKNLQSLHLFRVTVDKIEPGSICLSPSLNYLGVHDIKIQNPLTKEVFENCNMVSSFTFVYNYHANIAEKVFSGFTNARTVFLNYLNISTLTKGYLHGFSNVENLRIEESSFIRINSNAFENFNNLKKLLINGNKVSEIEAGAFSNLPILTDLDLSSNQLTTIDNISNKKLNDLDASSNNISRIDSRAVKENLPNLEYLTLIDNPIDCDYALELKQELSKLHTSCDTSDDVWPRLNRFR